MDNAEPESDLNKLRSEVAELRAALAALEKAAVIAQGTGHSNMTVLVETLTQVALTRPDPKKFISEVFENINVGMDRTEMDEPKDESLQFARQWTQVIIMGIDRELTRRNKT